MNVNRRTFIKTIFGAVIGGKILSALPDPQNDCVVIEFGRMEQIRFIEHGNAIPYTKRLDVDRYMKILQKNMAETMDRAAYEAFTSGPLFKRKTPAAMAALKNRGFN